jgi:hypothetical protein
VAFFVIAILPPKTIIAIFAIFKKGQKIIIGKKGQKTNLSEKSSTIKVPEISPH